MSCSLVGEIQNINIQQGSLVYEIYEEECITERFNCNYSFNEQYRDKLEDSNLQFVGASEDGGVRIIELPQHPFFLAMLFQPQLTSTATHAHPVIVEYLKAAMRKSVI